MDIGRFGVHPEEIGRYIIENNLQQPIIDYLLTVERVLESNRANGLDKFPPRDMWETNPELYQMFKAVALAHKKIEVFMECRREALARYRKIKEQKQLESSSQPMAQPDSDTTGQSKSGQDLDLGSIKGTEIEDNGVAANDNTIEQPDPRARATGVVERGKSFLDGELALRLKE